jgi:hypothetical protein
MGLSQERGGVIRCIARGADCRPTRDVVAVFLAAKEASRRRRADTFMTGTISSAVWEMRFGLR